MLPHSTPATLVGNNEVENALKKNWLARLGQRADVIRTAITNNTTHTFTPYNHIFSLSERLDDIKQ